MPGAPIKSNVGSTAAQCMTITGQAVPVIAVSDATAAAQSATELLTPTSIAGTAVQWIKRGAGIRGIRVRVRLTVATTVVTTAPVVRVIGAMVADGVTLPTTDSPNLSGSGVSLRRLDNASDTAAGITLAIAGSPSGTTALSSGTYRWGTRSDKIDLEDCDYYIVLVETAAAITGGACAVEVIEMN